MDAILDLVNQAVQSQNWVALVAALIAGVGTIVAFILKMRGKSVPLLDGAINLVLNLAKAWKPAPKAPSQEEAAKEDGIASVVKITDKKE